MKKYQIIYADPPWRYKNQNPPCLPIKQPETCRIEYYYPTLSQDEIKQIPVKELSDKDCILFLWATTPAIQESLDIMKHWGFKYKTMITWEKTNRDCMGYWFRVCTEHLLIGIKGKIKSFRSMERTLHSEPRLKHSEKPRYFRELIDRVAKGNKIELFARQKTEGWDVWGNEVESDIEL
jgi:N6-adenosine-specific RNA methylase IME4